MLGHLEELNIFLLNDSPQAIGFLRESGNFVFARLFNIIDALLKSVIRMSKIINTDTAPIDRIIYRSLLL
jgi:hypothetical protein